MRMFLCRDVNYTNYLAIGFVSSSILKNCVRKKWHLMVSGVHSSTVNENILTRSLLYWYYKLKLCTPSHTSQMKGKNRRTDKQPYQTYNGWRLWPEAILSCNETQPKTTQAEHAFDNEVHSNCCCQACCLEGRDTSQKHYDLVRSSLVYSFRTSFGDGN